MSALEFPALEGEKAVYLDNAATSLPPRRVLDAMQEYESGYRSNVARGIYPRAERATAAYADARATVAKSLDADPDEIVFTSGATAALNLAAALVSQLAPEGAKILVTELEHHSNIVPWMLAPGNRFRIEWARCNSAGELLTGDALELLRSGDIGTVAMTHASNVTGAILDAKAMCAAAREGGALSVVDGAQYVPHAFPSPRELGADFYAFSGHKCNGPTGVGVLWGRKELLERLQPAWGGGGMVETVGEKAATYIDSPARFEAGTPPIAAAIGLGAAIEWRLELEGNSEWSRLQARLESVDARIRSGLSGMREVELLGPPSESGRVPITSFNVGGIHPHDVCQVLGEAGVCVRGGHHCAQPLMRRMGIGSCVRSSLGPHVADSDADRLLESVEAAVAALK